MKTLTIPRLCARVGLALLLALLSACAALQPASIEKPWLGRIASIEGRNAFVDPGNAGTAQPARRGQMLRSGDRFYTGAGTRMKIDLAGGGYVELDENTDPLLQDLNCLVISLFGSGRIFVDKSNACVESLGTRSQQFSKVVYAVMPAGPYLQITVVDGEARTLQPAVAAATPTGWRIDLNSRGVLGAGRAYRVSDETIRQSIEWTSYYRSRSTPAPMIPFPIVRPPYRPVAPPPPRQPSGDSTPR